MSARKDGVLYATVRPSMFIVVCPYCGAPLPNPDNGAVDWEPFEVDEARGGTPRKCSECKRESRLRRSK